MFVYLVVISVNLGVCIIQIAQVGTLNSLLDLHCTKLIIYFRASLETSDWIA